MLTESMSRVCIYLLLLPAGALTLLFLFLRHKGNVHPWFVAAYLVPFLPLVGYTFQSNPNTYVIYLIFYVLGDVIRAIVPRPLVAKITGDKPPVLISILLLFFCAAFLLLLPFEIVGQSLPIAIWRNGLRYIITWTVCGYLFTRLRSLGAGIPRIGVFLFGVTSFINLPVVLIARIAGRMTGTRTAPLFFSYDQRVVDFYIGYAFFNVLIALLFIFMRPRPALTAVQAGAFDPEGLKALLSKREREIAILLCQGRSYREIADRLFIARNTVRNHCHSIFEKCKVTSRFELNHVLGSLLSADKAEKSADKPFAIEK
jgi:DNA-binding CsgD family transcriptional regulator